MIHLTVDTQLIDFVAMKKLCQRKLRKANIWRHPGFSGQYSHFMQNLLLQGGPRSCCCHILHFHEPHAYISVCQRPVPTTMNSQVSLSNPPVYMTFKHSLLLTIIEFPGVLLHWKQVRQHSQEKQKEEMIFRKLIYSLKALI